jgi:hypothetical protein
MAEAIETTVDPFDSLVGLARTGDSPAFAELARAIDWSTRQPEEILQVVDLALGMELVRLARDLAQQAANLFPEYERAQQAARVLAPPVARVVSPPGYVLRTRASAEWIQAHASEYQGQWVAVREGKLLGVAASLHELEGVIAQVGDLQQVIITKVT